MTAAITCFCFFGFLLFVVLYATRAVSRICQGMSRQHLHQPCGQWCPRLGGAGRRRGRSGPSPGEVLPTPPPRPPQPCSAPLLRPLMTSPFWVTSPLGALPAVFACYRGLLITLRTTLIIGSNHLITQTGWNRCNLESSLSICTCFFGFPLLWCCMRLELFPGSARGCPGDR